MLRAIDLCGMFLLFEGLRTGVVPENKLLSFIVYVWLGSFLTRILIGLRFWVR